MDNWSNPPQSTCYPFVATAFGSECKSPFNYVIERFTPPNILTGATRLVISSAPATLTHNSSFVITMNDASNLSRVTFVRYSTTTHSTNTDQRFVELVILYKTKTQVYLRAPPKSTLAPSGNWFLFALDSNRVPSVAKTINLHVGLQVDVIVPVVTNNGANITSNTNDAVNVNVVVTGSLFAAVSIMVALWNGF